MAEVRWKNKDTIEITSDDEVTSQIVVTFLLNVARELRELVGILGNFDCKHLSETRPMPPIKEGD